MNNKYIRGKILTALMLITMILIVMSGIISISFAQDGNIIETSSDNIANLTEDKFPITNENLPNGIDVKKYLNYNYSYNATLEWGKHKIINVNASDEIVKLIPDYLFKEVGVTQHLGKKYGFYIETRKPIANNDTLISTVVLIKVEVVNDMMSDKSRSHLKFKITPIFQGDFAFVRRGDKKICSIDKQEYAFFNDKYQHDVEVIYPSSGNEFVIPVPTVINGGIFGNFSIEFRQHNKFYLTEVSNQTSLYNVNQPNPYDEDYIAENDSGCFFSQSDFAYNGVYYQDGESSTNDVGNALFSATSMAFDYYDAIVGFKSVFKAIPYVGAIVSTFDLISSINEIEDKLKDSQINDSKRFTYMPYHNNKDQQIANGGLRKDEIIAVVGQHSNLLFGLNNYFEFDYQIHCQDINVDTRYATILNIGVVSVVSENASTTHFGDLNKSTSAFTDDVKNHTNQNYKEIPKFDIDKFEKEIDFKVLPNNDTFIEIQPLFSGKYTLELNHNLYAKFSLYEASINNDGSIDHNDLSRPVCNSQSVKGYAKSGEINLDASKRYMVFVNLRNQYREESISGRYGSLKMSVSFQQEIASIGSNVITLPYTDTYLKFNTTKQMNYRFAIDNQAAKKITLLDENLNNVGVSVNGQIRTVLAADTLYYIRIDMTASAATSAVMSIKDEMDVYFKNTENIDGSIVSSIIAGSTESVEMPVPRKTGYEFNGWLTSLERYGVAVNNDNILEFACPELMLYAKWTPIKYSIIYEENGGQAIADMQYSIENRVMLNQAIAYDGHVFRGWYDNPQLTGNAVSILESGNIGDKTFYARWISDSFTINLDIDVDFTDGISAGIENDKPKVKFGKAYALPVPQHIGFTFDGWYKYGVRYTDDDGVGIFNYGDEQDISLTAKWVRKNFYFKVGIDSNYKWLDSNYGDLKITDNEGGSFAYNTGMCPNCYITQLKINGYTNQNNELLASLFKTGCIFKAFVDNRIDKNVFCWNNLDASLIEGDVITVVLYHELEKNFTVIVNNENGVEIDRIELIYGDKLNYNVLPKKGGHSFDVYVVSDFAYNNRYNKTQFSIGSEFSYESMPDLSAGYEQDGNLIYIKALFTPNKYTVNFSNTDKGINEIQVVFGQPYNESGKTFPIGEREGNDFCGWEYTGKRIDQNGNEYVETRVIVNEKGEINEWNIPNDCVLKATWVLTKYTVKYALNGGTMPDVYPTWYTIETETFILPIPVKFGNKFAAWSNREGVLIDKITKGSKTDYELSAKWHGKETFYTEGGNYTINESYTIVNLTKANENASMTFIITNNVTDVTFIGEIGVKLYMKNINVNKRATSLLIRLKGINIISEPSKAVIDASDCNKLTIESVGVNNIGAYCRNETVDVKGALLCKNLDIIGDELHIMGALAGIMPFGGAIAGNHGIYGGGSDAQYVMNVSIKRLYVTGGVGSSGKTGGIGNNCYQYYGKAGVGKVGQAGIAAGNGGKGIDGGAGGAGIYYNGIVNIASSSKLVTTGGNGGRGGSGGSGGRGGDGGEGGDAAFLIYGKEGGKGGRGGNGGDGGKGGKAGKGITANQIIGSYSTVDGESGLGGNGVNGGPGGEGGLGGWNLKKTGRYPNGAQGDRGSNGNKGANGDKA